MPEESRNEYPAESPKERIAAKLDLDFRSSLIQAGIRADLHMERTPEGIIIRGICEDGRQLHILSDNFSRVSAISDGSELSILLRLSG